MMQEQDPPHIAPAPFAIRPRERIHGFRGRALATVAAIRGVPMSAVDPDDPLVLAFTQLPAHALDWMRVHAQLADGENDATPLLLVATADTEASGGGSLPGSDASWTLPARIEVIRLSAAAPDAAPCEPRPACRSVARR